MSDKNNIKTFTINIKNVPDLVLPKLGDPLASGYDITAISNPEIVGEEIAPGIYKNIQYIQYHTGIFINQTQEEDVVDFELDYGEYARISMINEALENKMSVSTHLQCFMFPRSSISKYNLILNNSLGLIDCSYLGEICTRFKYIYQPSDVVFLDPNKHPSFGIKVDESKIYQRGDRIAQLVFSEISPRIKFNIVDDLGTSQRGSGGFGSTGI